MSGYNLAPCNKLIPFAQWQLESMLLPFLSWLGDIHGYVLPGALNSALNTPGGLSALTMQEQQHRPVTVCVRDYACPDQGPEDLMSGRGSFPDRKLLVS